MSKVKILLVGTIGGHVNDFIVKISSLQRSKAGPFDLVLCVGSVSSEILASKEALPLPVYLQNASNLSNETTTTTTTTTTGLVELGPDLFALAGADVWSIDIPAKHTQLIVASCPPRVRLDSPIVTPLLEKISHVSYVGCDLFLSSEWPQGIEKLLSTPHETHLEVGSYDVAELALKARPRYHVAPHTVHLQSVAFSHIAATSSTFTTPKHSGRFLTLAPVTSPEQSKLLDKKLGKFVHALGLTPLAYMSVNEIESLPNIQPCPYTDASYAKDGGNTTSNITTNLGLSEAQARRLLSESVSNTGGDTHERWAASRKKRPPPTNDNDDDEVDSHNNSTTLFLHGLHKDVRGELQTASAALLQAFSKYNIERVRRPPAASSYAFLDFPSHEAAKLCLEELGGETVVAGVHLTLKWATLNPNNKTSNNMPLQKKKRLTEAEAMDSSTLYFRLPPKVLAAECVQASEDLRKLMETSLEHALADPNVTAETEPALQVKVRLIDDKNYGFLEFASHAAASMAVATLAGSTEGGQVIPEVSEMADKIPIELMGVALYWANDAKPPTNENDNTGGLQFRHHHFPPDSRTDCWFCLASPTCEKHLITTVHNECYITMPKGPVHPEGHVLIVPVTHSSKGALIDPSVAHEMEDLKQRLRQHASDVWQMDLFVFERAIQTKGGYHTHVQCVPVARGLGMNIQSTMVGRARAIPGFDLRELNSDLALAAMASSEDDNDDDGYFYAEVPTFGKEYKRFLYKAKATGEEGRRGPIVPLQFGREVLASVMDKPDVAHWKACVLDPEKETELATAFRLSFAKYEP